MQDEVWSPVVGFEGLYEVSNHGRVRSLPRLTPHYTGKQIVRGGKMLTGCVTKRGYVKFSLSKDGRSKGMHGHSLVAAAFIGPRPPGHVVRHLDGEHTHNTPSNLAYGTSEDNTEDMRRHGRLVRGEAHGKAKLTDAQVAEVRTRAANRETQASLAREYKMSVQQIHNIVRRHQRKD